MDRPTVSDNQHMTFARTHDFELVRATMTHPRIWPWISDDGRPDVATWKPQEGPGFWYITVHDGGEYLGLWMLTTYSTAMAIIHTCLLPSAWGARAAEAARQFWGWCWDNTPFRRIVTCIPAFNRLALRFAERGGMVRWGLNPKAWLHEGRMWDEVWMGRSPEEATCRQ